jgi:hypothetical protein
MYSCLSLFNSAEGKDATGSARFDPTATTFGCTESLWGI